jgi:hypothetical protein
MTEPTDNIDDQPLNEYLKGDSSVSRQYRQLSSEQVPPSLDRLVLRQAEDAVKRPSRPAWLRWAAPLAVAASAVLVVSIVIETGMQNEKLVSAPVTQSKRAAEVPIERRLIDESADVPPPPKLAVPPPEVADVQADSAPTGARRRSEPAPVAAPAPARAPEKKALATPPVANEAGAALAREQFANAERQKSQLEAAAREQLSASQRAMRGDQSQPADPRETIEKLEPKSVLSYSRPINVTTDNVATLQKTHTDPEAWLKEIRQLRTDNKQEEADREWRRFRETFPDYEVAETDAAREPKK